MSSSCWGKVNSFGSPHVSEYEINNQTKKDIKKAFFRFAGMTFTIFDAVANINNRINSNNNNNNNDNVNFQQSINTVVTGNINVANQINVMNVMGRRKRDAQDRTRKQNGISAETKRKAAQIARKGFEAMISLDRSLMNDQNIHSLENRVNLYNVAI